MMKGVSLIADGDGTERASHAMCVCRIRTVYPSVDADTNTCIVLVTGTAAVRLAFLFGQRLGCRGKPGRAGANGGGRRAECASSDVVRRCHGPGRPEAVLERVPRRQEQRRGFGERKREEGKEGGKKVRMCRRRAGGVGADLGRVASRGDPLGAVTSVRAYFWFSA